MGGGIDEDVSIGGAALAVACCLNILVVVDEEDCRKKDHGGEECDCVHSCIFFNC